MRLRIFVTALLLLPTGTVTAQDPVKVDPDHYKVEFENEAVRVLRVSYGPHEKSVMHEHPGGVFVMLTEDQRWRFTLPDGTSIVAFGSKGDTGWGEAETHEPENLTDKRLELIFIELKIQSENPIR